MKLAFGQKDVPLSGDLPQNRLLAKGCYDFIQGQLPVTKAKPATDSFPVRSLQNGRKINQPLGLNRIQLYELGQNR